MTQRSILITGCSSGIGYNAAHGLRARGWRVFAACRQQADCERLRAEGFDSPRIDYADEASIEQAVAEVLDATGGRLDALFNNGAYACPGLVEDLPRGALREIFESNFFGWHDLTRQVIPAMRAQGHGRIVQCSSVLGLVTLCLIEPGPVTTKIRENARAPFERWIDWESAHRMAEYRDKLRPRLYGPYAKDNFELPPEAVTKKLIHALEAPRPKARYYVTTPTYLMGTLRRILPTRLLDWVISKA